MKMTQSLPQVLAVVTLLAGTLAFSAMAGRRRADTLALPLSTIPDQLAGWVSIGDRPLSDNVLGKLTPTSYLSRTYQKGGRQLGVFIAYYAQQRAGESMHSPKHCLPGSGWEIWDYGSAIVPVSAGGVRINRYSVHNGGVRALVLYWYQSRQRVIASEYVGKILLVRDALVDGNTAGSIVKITSADTPEALTDALEFASQLMPRVKSCFQK
jgi:EpsI family protein